MTPTFAFFLGCNIPARMPWYADSARAVADALGIGLVSMPAFSCCGYPLKNPDAGAAALSAARNLALAEEKGLDVVTLCSCCHGALATGQWLLEKDPGLAGKVNGLLALEGLKYRGKARVRHFLNVVDEEAGEAGIRERVKKPLDGLPVAIQYGCHLLRPSRITRVDDPMNPTVCDRLLSAAGCRSVAYGRKMDCCGAPVLPTDPDMARRFAQRKLASAREAGAEVLVPVCTYCHLFLSAQPVQEGAEPLPLMTFTQVLARALGVCSL